MNGQAQVQRWRPGMAPAEEKALADRGEEAGSRMPFRALMAFTFVLLLAPQSFIHALAPLRLGLLTAAVALLAYVLDCFMRREPVVALTREMVLAGGLAGWAIVTIPLSYWPGGSLSFLLEGYFKTLVIFYLLANVVTTRRRLRLVAWGLSLMAVPLAAFGVREYLAGRFIDGGPVKRILSYEAPLTQNPNDLALMLNLILPLAVALFLLHRHPAARAGLVLIIGLLAVAVMVTFSRGGFLTLATIFLVYVVKLLRRPGRGWAVAALTLALACAPLLPSSYMERMGTITDIEGDPTGSAQERWNDTLATLRLVSRSPLVGAGVGMNMLALNDLRGPIWKEVHNVYLEYAADLGLPGLLLFLAILVGCLRATVLIQRRTQGDPEQRDLYLLAEGLQTSLLAFSVAAVFHPVAYHFYFYYIAGLTLGARAASGAVAKERA